MYKDSIYIYIYAGLRNRGSGTPLKPTRRRNRNTALCAVFRAGPAAGTQHKVLCSGTLRCCYIARCDSLARLRWSTWQLRCCTPVGTNPSKSKLQPIGKAIPADNVVSRDQRMTGDTVTQDSSKDQHTHTQKPVHAPRPLMVLRSSWLRTYDGREQTNQEVSRWHGV